ncbi:hypothetical protein [Pseudotamlana carrageenivorans]|uniref:RHS repeat-associated core domain-containing protein n=1 Tax=Pseudotamlana carrageenivorans TaxID=2069432 RepID=A0A2I7SG87_9FLAO|nr:hypothetical protein [Tamlana carrageenivorans]AUS04921.1 hypothetical protein C1A40_05305 [Tamlana carrageenivorans]
MNTLQSIANNTIPKSLLLASCKVETMFCNSSVSATSNLPYQYHFGMPMPGRNMNNGDYRYGFGGHEKDDEIKGNGNHYEFAGFGLDPRLGKRWNIDPHFRMMPAWSPYSIMFNNPLSFTDPSGLYPIYIITRSYAPFKWFGPGNEWHGDNRGHTLDRGASYRGLASITHDTETLTTEAFGGRSRSYTKDFSKDAISPTEVSNRSSGNNIDVHSSAGNEAQVGAQPIDQFTKLKVTTSGDIKQDHVLNITGTISGDDFPNQESFIYDSEGNSLWLGNFETSGDQQWGPVFDLFFENEDDVNINVDISIKVNKDGVFQGVMQGDKMISIEDWNKQFKSDDNASSDQ